MFAYDDELVDCQSFLLVDIVKDGSRLAICEFTLLDESGFSARHFRAVSSRQQFGKSGEKCKAKQTVAEFTKLAKTH